MIRFLTLSFVLFLAPLSLLAQSGPLLSGGLIAGMPQGNFGKHLTTPSFGMGAFFGDRITGLPLALGLDVGLLLYGLESRDWPYQTPYSGHADAFTTRGIGMAHFVVRLQDPQQSVSPYADLLIGAKYIFTDTRVDGGVWDYARDPYPETAPFDDLAFSYGMGGGIRLNWFVAPGDGDRPPGRITMHAGVRYLFGAPAEFLTRDSAIEDEGGVSYVVRRSRTDLLVPELGFSLSLW